jgi:hypothetical protein
MCGPSDQREAQDVHGNARGKHLPRPGLTARKESDEPLRGGRGRHLHNMHTARGPQQEAGHRPARIRALATRSDPEIPPLDDASIGRNIHHQCGWRVLPPPRPMMCWPPHLAVRIPVTKSVDGPGGHHLPLQVRAVSPSLMQLHGAPAGFPTQRETGGSGTLARTSARVRQVVEPHLAFPGSGALRPGFLFARCKRFHPPAVR